MSVAIDVSSELRERSTPCHRCIGRSSGVPRTTSSGAETSTRTPMRTDVLSTMAATTR